MPQLSYKFPPLVAFTIVSGMMGLLTYGSFMISTGRGTQWFESRSHNIVDEVALGFLFKLNSYIFVSDALLVNVCAIAWIIHVGEAAYAFAKAKANNGSLAVCTQYGLGALLVGVLQLQVQTAAIKRLARK